MTEHKAHILGDSLLPAACLATLPPVTWDGLFSLTRRKLYFYKQRRMRGAYSQLRQRERPCRSSRSGRSAAWSVQPSCWAAPCPLHALRAAGSPPPWRYLRPCSASASLYHSRLCGLTSPSVVKHVCRGTSVHVGAHSNGGLCLPVETAARVPRMLQGLHLTCTACAHACVQRCVQGTAALTCL